MKTGILAALAGAIAMIFSAAAWGQGQVPSGPYKGTCSSYRMQGALLMANCRDARGAPIPTSINPAICGSRAIVNINGGLSCALPPGAERNTSLPMGSYRGVCPDITMSGSRLSATCFNATGGKVRSSLDLAKCYGRDIAAQDGRLVCSYAAADTWSPPATTVSAIPDGSYRATCPIVSRSLNTLKARCKDERGETVKSELDLKSCKDRDILNVDGRLVCGN